MSYIQVCDLEVDELLQIKDVRGAAELVSGYAPDELRGKSISALLSQRAVTRLKTQLHEVQENEQASKKFSIYKLVHKNGDSRQCYVYPVSSGTHFTLHIIPEISGWDLPFISTDTRTLFFEAFSDMPMGTFEWYIDANQVFWSEGIYRIYELEDKAELLDLDSLQRYTHPDDKRLAGAAVQRALDAGRPYDIEIKVVTARGNMKIVQAMGKPVAGANGTANKLVGCIRDITGQRRTEEDLKTSVSDLYRSNRELEEFAYAASHDLQEPLRKISTFSDRLLHQYKDSLTGDGAMYLDRVISASQNMRKLIDNLLDFSRLTQAEESFSSVSIRFIVSQVLSDLEILLEETGAVVEYDGDLPDVEASVVQMKQLFTNLLNNAIKFRRANTVPKIKITAERLSEDEKNGRYLNPMKEYIKISVADNGIGFEEEYAKKIFQIFQRLHGKAEYPGSGIGLAICKKIVEKHHGIMYAEGRVNSGATFTIILPEKQNEV